MAATIICKSDACQHKRVAVLIGINYAGTQNALAGCENDVAAMQQALRARFGFNEFIVMTEKALKPTKANILLVLTRLAERTKTDGVELVFLQFSGHGTSARDTTTNNNNNNNSNIDESDGRDEALVPLDMDLLLDDDLRRIVNTFSPWCRVVALVDSCHSGTIFDLPLQWQGPQKVTRPNETAPVCDMIVISGCRDDQTSADTRDKITGVPGGALTLAFRETMFTAPTLFGLMDCITKYMTDNGYTQRPQLSSSRVLAADDTLSRWLR